MNLPQTEIQRKSLRNHSTPSEATLWKLLKGKQLCGLKFRRQHSVGPYILDFYCPQLKLAIELDGEVHNTRQLYDEQRAQYLAKQGIQVLRFENRTVFEDPERILTQVEECNAKGVASPQVSESSARR